MKRKAVTLPILALMCLGAAGSAWAAGSNDRVYFPTISPASVAPNVAQAYVLRVSNYSQGLCQTCTPLHFIQYIQIAVPAGFTLVTPTGGSPVSTESNWRVVSIANGKLPGSNVTTQIITVATISSNDASLVVGKSVNITINAKYTGTVNGCAGSASPDWQLYVNQSNSGGGGGNVYALAPGASYPKVTVSSSDCLTPTNLALTLVTSNGNQSIRTTDSSASVTLTAKLTSALAPNGIAGEFILFSLGAPVPGCTAVSTNGSGIATCTFSPQQTPYIFGNALGAGTYGFTASFATDTAPSPDLGGSTSPERQLTVNADGTGIAVSDASTAYGGTVNLKACLTATAGPVPGKSITFMLGSTNEGTATTDTSGADIGCAHLSNVSTAGYGVGPYNNEIKASFAGDTTYGAVSGEGNLTITQGTYTITWPTPASIVYGTALSGTQLNATASIPGTFVYTPAAGSILNAGTQTLSAVFTPTDQANYSSQPASVQLVVNQAPSTTVVTCPSSVTYTGAPLTPCSVSVTGANLSLTPTPNYSNNTNVGTASASYTYAGDANHTGSGDSKNFAIDKATSTTAISCPDSVTYSGAALTPCTVTISGAGGLSLTPTASYSNNTNVGTATASYTWAGDSNHTGSSDSKNFAIAKASSSTAITCPSSVTFTGAAQEPCTVSVTGVGGLSLTPTPSYSNNTNAGSATASYTYAGDANHNGSTDTKNFAIDKASSATAVTCPSSVTFTGAAQEPCTVSVTGVGGLSLAPSPSYSNNTNAGTATASYTYAGDANHNGSTDTKNFAIDKASSTTAVTCPSSVTFTGAALTPCSVAVTGAGGLSLTPTPTYSDNTNVGTATASYTFAGDANHNGSNDTKTFAIDKASSATAVTCPASVTYTGAALTPCSVAVTGAGGLSLTPTPTYSDNTNVGTATASYTWAGDANHTGSSDSKTFAIDKAGSTTAVTCPASVTYTGAALTPCSVAVTGAGGLSLAPTASYSNNTNAGTATASYTWAGDANHTGSSDSKNFSIAPAPSYTTVTCPASVTYTGSALTPCSAAVTGAGGLSLTPTPSYSNNTNAGTATASFTYTGDANHSGSGDSKNFAIAGASQTITFTSMIVAAKATSGGTVTFSTTTPTLCQVAATTPPTNVDGDYTAKVTLLPGGTWATCKVQADQSGTSNYDPAPQATAILGTQP